MSTLRWDVSKILRATASQTSAGGRPYNQDTCDIASFGRKCGVAAVYDGHGEYGQQCAEFVRDRMRAELRQAHATKGVRSEALSNAFVDTHTALVKSDGTPPGTQADLSGSTASVAWLWEDELMVGHAGDSSVVVVRREPDTAKLTASQVTVNHHPDVEGERARIEARGGRVDQKYGKGPFRLYQANLLLPGLMVSRSLGDSVAHAAGGSAEPDLLSFGPDPNLAAIVLASDGLWDTVKPEAVADVVSHHSAPKAACEALMAMAASGHSMDNITVVVSYLYTTAGGRRWCCCG